MQSKTLASALLAAATLVAFAAPVANATTVTIGETALVPNSGNLDGLSPQGAPVFQGDSSGGYVLSAPAAGTITSWSFLSAGAGTGSMYSLRVLRPLDNTGTSWLAVATSTPVAITTATGVDDVNGPFSTNIQVAAGDRIALEPEDSGSTPIETGVGGQDGARFFDAAFTDGSSASISAGSSADNGQVVPIQATEDLTPPPPPQQPPQEVLGDKPAIFLNGSVLYADSARNIAKTTTIACGTGTWAALPLPSSASGLALAYAHQIEMRIVRTSGSQKGRLLADATVNGTMNGSQPPLWDTEPANPLLGNSLGPIATPSNQLYNFSRAFYGHTNVRIGSVTDAYTDGWSNALALYGGQFLNTVSTSVGGYPAGIGNPDPNLPGQGVLFRAYQGVDAQGNPSVPTYLVYQLTGNDLGSTLQCQVVATNGGSSPSTQATGQATSQSYLVSSASNCGPTELTPRTSTIPSSNPLSAGFPDIAGWFVPGQPPCLKAASPLRGKFYPGAPNPVVLSALVAGGKASVGVPCTLVRGCAGATLRLLATSSALRRAADVAGTAAARLTVIGSLRIRRSHRAVLRVLISLPKRARTHIAHHRTLLATAQLLKHGKVVLSAHLVIEKIPKRKR